MPLVYEDARASFIQAALTTIKDAKAALAKSLSVESELRSRLDAQEDYSRNLRLYVSELERTHIRRRSDEDQRERQRKTDEKLAKARAAKAEKAVIVKINTAWLFPIRAAVNLTPPLPEVVLAAIEDKVKVGTYNDEHLQRLAMFIMGHQPELAKMTLIKAHQIALGKVVKL